ncbi:GBF-interacting protein 1-like [Sesamum indicum]|uniref:GBF-interacting protein 1-like n=1 Tax=Sesamum indicum TaxID=4182 RepID=A0A6I9U850_SESIN|nr:GBF-interacting protein 1-like [Sesamum indicum]
MSGFSRVSISDSLRKTIQDIKEITGKHSDEDVYAMLKECNMDPNETAQKLLYLDTFHEVRRKRDRRKVGVNIRAQEEYRRTPGMQRRGNGGGNYVSSYNSDDAVRGRQLNARRQNGYNSRMGRASKASMPVLRKDSNIVACDGGSTAAADTSICDGSSSHESTSQLVERNDKGVIKETKADYGNKSGKVPSLRPVLIKQLSNVDPGPTPTPTPTNSSIVASGARNDGGSLKSKSSHVGNSVGSTSVSGLYASASDPVLVPSLNPRNLGSVGIIKREKGSQRNTAETSINLQAESRMNAVQSVAVGQAVPGSVELTSSAQPMEYKGVERAQLAESPLLPSSSSHQIAAANDNQETCAVRPVNGPPKEILSEAVGVAPEANINSLPTLEDSSSEQATAEVDTKLNKLHISSRQSVIFPNHLHVPEAFKNALTFGSLDAHIGKDNEDSNTRDVSITTNVEASKEPSPTHQSSSPRSGSDYHDRPQSPPNVLVNLTSPQENVSSGTALRYDQSKQEMQQTVGGPQNPVLPPVPDYGLSLVPPVVGSHLVQLEGLEPQGGNSLIPSTTASTPSMSQPRGIAQSSITVSPQLFPFLRQPYPPNYIPYSPYFSQLYMPPQNAHQLLSHSGFPQQHSAGNIYMPPTAAAASGVKFPIYKPGNIAGNLTHFGISSSYGSYGASGLGYGSSAALPPGTSSNDDLTGSELKEKNIYSAIKQNEDLHILTSASGRDVSALQANVFYNLPQGHPLAFSPAQVGHNSFPGIYHPTQSMSTPSLVQSLQQSQPTGGSVESIIPPLSSYPQPQLQPQPQLLPLPQQYGQMNWNQKLLNRENI